MKSFNDLLDSIARRKIRIPTYRKMIATISEQYIEAKKKLAIILGKQKYVCLTTDVWSSRAQAYLGVTVHFITDEFERKSFLLAFRQLRGKQTYKILAEAITNVLDDFQIKLEQITHIVTDGGSTFCKAFKEYGNTFPDYEVDNMDEEDDINEGGIQSHEETATENEKSNESTTPFFRTSDGALFYADNINLEEHTSRSEERIENNFNDDLIRLDENVDFFEENNLFEFDPENVHAIQSNRDTDKQYKLPQQRRCVSHLLNLVSIDFEKRLSGLSKKYFSTTMDRIQPLWVRCKRSAYAKQICQETLGIVLMLPCVTRWNSKFDAMKQLLNCGYSKINELISSLNLDLTKLTPNEWKVIEAYIAVMSPVASALDQLQGEENASQGYILPTLHSMRHHITQLEGSSLLLNFKSLMLSLIEERFTNQMKIDNMNCELVLASVSLPMFKTQFIFDDDEECLAQNILRIEMLKCALESIEIAAARPSENEPEENNRSFFVSKHRQNDRRLSQESTVASELERYLCDTRKSLSILNEYPNVRRIYLRYNTTLSASAAVERVFSQALMIFTPRRNRLNDAKFEKTLFFKINRTKLNEIDLNK